METLISELKDLAIGITYQQQLNGQNDCPRCHTGVIIPDGFDKVCLNCGLRDSLILSRHLVLKELFLNWLIRNKPRELYVDYYYSPRLDW